MVSHGCLERRLNEKFCYLAQLYFIANADTPVSNAEVNTIYIPRGRLLCLEEALKQDNVTV